MGGSTKSYKSKRSRKGSITSIDTVSVLSDAELEKEQFKAPASLAGLLLDIKKLTTEVLGDESTSLSAAASTKLELIKSYANKAIKKERCLTDHLKASTHRLETQDVRYETLKEATKEALLGESAINEVTSRILTSIATELPGLIRPGYELIIHELYKGNDLCNAEIKNLQISIDALKSSLESGRCPDTPTPAEPEISIVNEVRNGNQQSRVPQESADLSEDSCTIMVRPVSVTSGERLKQELEAQSLSSSARVLKLLVRSRHVEIVCASRSDKKTLLEALRSHATLARIATYSDKEPPLQKVIILNVPEPYQEQQILGILEDSVGEKSPHLIF